MEGKDIKFCVVCRQRKPKSEFAFSNKAKDGLRSWCKECHDETRLPRIDSIEEKKCKKCERLLPVDEFKRGSNGYRKLTCRECINSRYRLKRQQGKCSEEIKARARAYYHRNKDEIKKKLRWHRLMIKYGITKEQYQAMLAAIGGKCPICSVKLEEPCDSRKDAGVVDHCHKTGSVRGILCARCNTAIGLIDEDVSRLEPMKKYLEAHGVA